MTFGFCIGGNISGLAGINSVPPDLAAARVLSLSDGFGGKVKGEIEGATFFTDECEECPEIKRASCIAIGGKIISKNREKFNNFCIKQRC